MDLVVENVRETELSSDDETSVKLPQDDKPYEGFTSTNQPVNHSILIINNRLSGIGFQLWPAARVMCRFIDEKTCQLVPMLAVEAADASASRITFAVKPVDCFTDWSNVRVCELGAGCGLVAMFAASLGAKVTVTDLPMVLPHIASNVLANPSLFVPKACDNYTFDCSASNGSINIAPLSWGDADVIEQSKDQLVFDLLLLSDCVYWEDLFEPLLFTLRGLIALNPACKVWLAQSPRRPKVEARFFKAARKHFDVSVIAMYKHDPNDRQMVSVYQFTSRAVAAGQTAVAKK